jgi:hypothetical protein
LVAQTNFSPDFSTSPHSCAAHALSEIKVSAQKRKFLMGYFSTHYRTSARMLCGLRKRSALPDTGVARQKKQPYGQPRETFITACGWPVSGLT